MYMKLLTKELLKKLPPLYSQENNPDPLVICKFFTLDAQWTWYVTEGSPVDKNGFYDTDQEKVDFCFFGLVVGIETELGYFSLSELQTVRGALGLPVERDRFFVPKLLSEVEKLHAQR
jgi:DUF2958 family protein